MISIHDDGVGIPQNITFGESTGFGLNLVEAMMKQLEGTVKVENHNGTKFMLTFPLLNQP